jgi:hypothetical protein
MVYVLLETISLFLFPLMALRESEGGGGEDNMGLLSSSSQPLSNTITPLGLPIFGMELSYLLYQ